MNEAIKAGIDSAKEHKPTAFMIITTVLLILALAVGVGGMIIDEMVSKAHAEEIVVPKLERAFDVEKAAKKCLGCHRSGKNKFQNRLTAEEVKSKLIHFRRGEGKMSMVRQARPLSMENILALAQYFGKKKD